VHEKQSNVIYGEQSLVCSALTAVGNLTLNIRKITIGWCAVTEWEGRITINE